VKATKSISRLFYPIALALLAAIGVFGYFGSADDRRELNAVAEIEKLGGSVRYAEEMPDTPVTQVNFTGLPVTDADLVHLKGLTDLRIVTLDSTQVSDAGLIHLRELANLRHLDIRNTQVTDAGMEHVAGLTNLQYLTLVTRRLLSCRRVC